MNAINADGGALLSLREVREVLAGEVRAVRAALAPGARDPFSRGYSDSDHWVRAQTERETDPLPIAQRGVGGGRGGGHRFDQAAVRAWWSRELQRRQHAADGDVIQGEGDGGTLLTAIGFAREIGRTPQDLQRRLADYGVQPARVTDGGRRYYRLADLVEVLLAGARQDDPDSLPPTDRDAHYRAEARKDALLLSRRELVTTADAVTVVNALAGLLRDACDLIPDALESRCQLAPEALVVVERELDVCRAGIADQVRQLAARLQDPDAPLSPPADEDA